MKNTTAMIAAHVIAVPRSGCFTIINISTTGAASAVNSVRRSFTVF